MFYINVLNRPLIPALPTYNSDKNTDNAAPHREKPKQMQDPFLPGTPQVPKTTADRVPYTRGHEKRTTLGTTLKKAILCLP